MSEEMEANNTDDEIQSAMTTWKAYLDKPCRPPFLVPSDQEIQAAYVLADAYVLLKADNTDELIEAMKEGFAVRLADEEAKAERYRLAIERCRRIIESGSVSGSDISDMHWILAEATGKP